MRVMLKNIYNLCKPGGRVIGVHLDPSRITTQGGKTDIFNKYNVKLVNAEGKDFTKDGVDYETHFINKEGGMETVYPMTHYTDKTYEDTFKEQGFEKFQWIDTKQRGGFREGDIWSDAVKYNPLRLYKAYRP
jgi:hypothetical protein